MPRNKYNPDYAKLYPGVHIDDEVLTVLKRSDRKMEYMELDLKIEPTVKDEDGNVIALLPSREDSLDRLMEADKQFTSSARSPEQLVEANETMDELYRSLDKLSADERALVDALFFEELTEREYGARIGLSQKNVNKHKHRVVAKLENFLSILGYQT